MKCNMTNEQIISVIKSAPIGSQFYTDGYDVKYRKVVGDKYFGYLDEAKGWVETCDKELSQERIDKGWWIPNLTKVIESREPQTKDAEWVNGDECLSSTGNLFTFIGLCNYSGFDCILLSKMGVPTFGFTKELSKPETPEQKLEREFVDSVCWDVKSIRVSQAVELFNAGYRKLQSEG
ncbi:hypothetical protein VPHK359_0045 [Vibrio phage K359]